MALIKFGTDKPPRPLPKLLSFGETGVGSIFFTKDDKKEVFAALNSARKDIRESADKVSTAGVAMAGAFAGTAVVALYLGTRKGTNR